MNLHFKLLLTFLLSIINSYLITYLFLKKRNKKNINIYQREELINKSKKNNIPLGGFTFVIATIITLFIIDFRIILDKNVLLILLPSLVFFILGFIDDYLKKKSYKGLSALLRSIVEIVVAFLFLYFLPLNEYVFNLPFNNYIYLGSLIILIIPIIIFGTTNSLNLTDGMDGLLSFLFLIASLPIILKSLIDKEYNTSLLLISLYGSLISYLRFNIHPASIFMGDQGSLFLGGIFAFSSFVLKIEYLLPISGFIFVVETLSVIMQVISFNLFKKRVFLMTPIHHHYEIKGVKEWKVVYMFILVEMILVLISISLIL